MRRELWYRGVLEEDVADLEQRNNQLVCWEIGSLTESAVAGTTQQLLYR